jgi:N-acetyl-anhydromuramyl-L-alanine amidase AmpD
MDSLPQYTAYGSKYFSSRGGVCVDTIVIHYTWGGNDVTDLKSLSGEAGNRKASCHWLVGRQRDGYLWQVVPEEKKAWHARKCNSRSIGIEVVAKVGQALTEKQNETLIKVIRYTLQKYGLSYKAITAHKWTPQATACPANLFCSDTNIESKMHGLKEFLNWRSVNFEIDFPAAEGERDRVIVS